MDDIKRRLDNLIAELRLKDYTVEQIRDFFEDSLDDVLSDERDGEYLGRYS